MNSTLDLYTEYQKLWEHVSPTYPLFLYDAPANSIELGPITAESDQFDYSPGPMHYWYRELDSGIRVVLQRPSDMHDHYRFINVYADKPDITQIIDELNLPLNVSWRSDQDKDLWQKVLDFYTQHYCYELVRLDDNNNEYVIESNLCENGARCMALSYERKGHKQSYYVRRVT